MALTCARSNLPLILLLSIMLSLMEDPSWSTRALECVRLASRVKIYLVLCSTLLSVVAVTVPAATSFALWLIQCRIS